MTWAREPSEEDRAFLEGLGFREPHYPYVVFRMKFWEALDNKKHGEERLPDDIDGFRPYEHFCTVNVGGCHCQPEKLERNWMMRRGGKLITWGNFPRPTDPIARLLSDKEKGSPWEILERWAIGILDGEKARAAKENALLEQLKLANERAEKAEAELLANKEKKGDRRANNSGQAS